MTVLGPGHCSEVLWRGKGEVGGMRQGQKTWKTLIVTVLRVNLTSRSRLGIKLLIVTVLRVRLTSGII